MYVPSIAESFICQLTLHKYKNLNSVTVITLLTDLGSGSAELASLKGHLSHINPPLQIVDIHHQSDPANYFAPAFLLRSYHRHFPTASVHLVSVDVDSPPLHLLAVCEDRFFLAADNGILPMALDGASARYYRLNHVTDARLPARDIYVPAVAKLLANGGNPESVGVPFTQYVVRNWQQPFLMGDFVRITVLYNDEQGNAYTNIDRSWVKENMQNRNWHIKLGFNDYIEPSDHRVQYSQTGKAYARWTENDFLMIGLHGASAAALMGFRRNHDIMIEFY